MEEASSRTDDTNNNNNNDARRTTTTIITNPIISTRTTPPTSSIAPIINTTSSSPPSHGTTSTSTTILHSNQPPTLPSSPSSAAAPHTPSSSQSVKSSPYVNKLSLTKTRAHRKIVAVRMDMEMDMDEPNNNNNDDNDNDNSERQLGYPMNHNEENDTPIVGELSPSPPRQDFKFRVKERANDGTLNLTTTTMTPVGGTMEEGLPLLTQPPPPESSSSSSLINPEEEDGLDMTTATTTGNNNSNNTNEESRVSFEPQSSVLPIQPPRLDDTKGSTNCTPLAITTTGNENQDDYGYGCDYSGQDASLELSFLTQPEQQQQQQQQQQPHESSSLYNDDAGGCGSGYVDDDGQTSAYREVDGALVRGVGVAEQQQQSILYSDDEPMVDVSETTTSIPPPPLSLTLTPQADDNTHHNANHRMTTVQDSPKQQLQINHPPVKKESATTTTSTTTNWETMDFMERVEARKQRNDERLITLGLKAEPKPELSPKEEEITQPLLLPRRRKRSRTSNGGGGMIFRTNHNSHSTTRDSYTVPQPVPAGIKSEPPFPEKISSLPQPNTCPTLPLPTTTTTTRMELLERDYPHRSPQIRLLHSLFTATVRQAARHQHHRTTTTTATSRGIYVPPPVYITGSSGSGKTGIVCRVLRELPYCESGGSGTGGGCASSSGNGGGRNSKIGVAYVNCATMESANVGVLLDTAYTQLLEDFSSSSGLEDGDGSDGVFHHTKKKKKKHQGTESNDLLQMESFLDVAATDAQNEEDVARVVDMVEEEQEDEEELEDYMEKQRKSGERFSGGEAWKRRKQHRLKGKSTTAATTQKSAAAAAAAAECKDKDGGTDRRITRSVGTTNTGATTTAGTNDGGKLLSASNAKKRMSAAITTTTTTHRSLFQTPMAFGRAVSRFCGVSNYGSRIYGGCAFLVIDHADKLFSLSSEDRNGNFLSQLLLLPKVMELNLTIVVITNNVLLEFTRVNNVQGLESVGYIADAVHPFRCHFHAYRGKHVFIDILTTAKLRQCVTGATYDTDTKGNGQDSVVSTTSISALFICTLHKSLVEIVVQSVENTTRDIREMQRLLRLLWPLYLDPLVQSHKSSSSYVDPLLKEFSTILISGSAKSQRHLLENKTNIGNLLAKLGGLARVSVTKLLSSNILCPSQGGYYDHISATISNNNAANLSFSKRLPYLTKFVLLAAYLCQKNKAALDQTLHTGKKAGKRKRRRGGTDNSSGEVAYASSVKMQQELKVSRVPSFPLERMLSVFTSICSKYGKGSMLLVLMNDEPDYCHHQICNDEKIDVRQLGSVCFFESLAQLQDLGFLQDVRSGASSVNLNAQRRYKCNLSQFQAQDICDQLGFPLSEYITGQ